MKWDHPTLQLNDVVDWICKKVDLETNEMNLIEVYRSNDWAITAKFQLPEQQRNVVIKIGFLPIFKPSPLIYQLLMKAAPGHVPYLIGYELKDSQTWMLFKEFEGESIRELQDIDSIKRTALSLAKIQLSVSQELKDQPTNIPVLPLNQIPLLYRELVQDIKTKYIDEWKNNKEQIQSNFSIPTDEMNKLLSIAFLEDKESQIVEWVNHLKQCEVSLSIYHIDLHTANAVLQESGDVLIYDWEEGLITHPFFSLQKLLQDARALDSDDQQNQMYTSSEEAVKDTYLSNISRDQKKKLSVPFDVARCLAPIVYIYQSQFFLRQVGWEKDAPGLIAKDLSDAIKLWEKSSS